MSLETKANTPQPTQTQPQPKTPKNFVLGVVIALILFLSQTFFGLILGGLVLYISFQVMVAGYNGVPAGAPEIESRITIPVSIYMRELIWSGDSEKIIVSSFSEILIVDSETGADIISFTATSFNISPNGNVLVYVNLENSKSNYHFYDLVTMREVAIIPGFLGFFSYTPLDRSWSPDERLTFVFDNFTNAQVNIWNVETQALVKTIGPATSASWSPTHELLVTTFDNEVTIWNTTNWTIEKKFDVGIPIWDVVWSPDSTRLILMLDNNNTTAQEFTMGIWDVATESEITQVNFIVREYTMTSDNAYLLAVSDYNLVNVWDAHSGAFVRQVSTQLGSGDNPFQPWSPNGNWIINSPTFGEYEVVNTVTGERVKQIRGFEMAWSPDGTQLAVVSSRLFEFRYDIYIYDTSTWEVVAVLNNFEGYISSIIWSPDGQKIMAKHPLDSDSIQIWDVP